MSSVTTEADHRIGARVRATRLALGLSQTSVGDSLDLSYQQIQKYELGINRLSVVTLQKIAEILGVPASTFLDPEHRAGKGGHSMMDASALDEARQSLLRLAETLALPALVLKAEEDTGHITHLSKRRRDRDERRFTRRDRRQSAQSA